MNNKDIPVWEKYTLIMNGNRIQIKRRQFERVIDKLDAI